MEENQENIPLEMNSILSGEIPLFIIKSKYAYPKTATVFLFVFALIWLAISVFIAVSFTGPLFVGKEIHYIMNDIPTVASLDNPKSLMFPVGFVSVFLLAGFSVLIAAIKQVYTTGPWFAATEKRLVVYEKNKTRSIDWEQFNGDIEISGTEEKGDIKLNMRTGQMISQKSGGSKYVPDIIYILDIENPYKIGDICRKKIKENDPTPLPN